MYKEDWVLREIENLIRVVSKIIFHKDKVKYEIVDDSIDSKMDLIYKEILGLLENLKINEAENLLFHVMEEGNMDYLKLALDFYNRLNKLDDQDLEKGQFTREEVKEGLEDAFRLYNIDSLNLK